MPEKNFSGPRSLSPLHAFPLSKQMAAQPTCYKHSDRLSVEHCEVCQRPVCGACLWYAESGERLCPEHATEWLQAGKTVSPPETYAEGIHHSQASAAQLPAQNIPYKGNGTDLTALAALITGVTALFACAGLYYLIPILALGLGLVAVLQAKDALNPSRARWMGMVGLASGGLFLMFVLGIIVFFSACMILAMLASSSGSGPVVVTPPPFLTATP